MNTKNLLQDSIYVFLDGMKYLSIITIIGISSLTIATVSVSFFLYNDYNSWKKDNPDYDDNSDSDDTIDSDDNSACDSDKDFDKDFEIKYINEYEELNVRDMESDELITFKDKFVHTKTPRGPITMCYDTTSDSFNYYADTKNIPYKYLETVGRFYVIEHDCKKIFIDYQKELTIATENYTAKILEQEKVLEKEKAGKYNIFAKFKSYNIENSNINKNNSNINKNNSNINRDNSNINKNNSNIKISPEKSNSYIYKGKYSDYEEYCNINKTNLHNIDNEFEHLDYAAYKKLDNELEKKKIL